MMGLLNALLSFYKQKTEGVWLRDSILVPDSLNHKEASCNTETINFSNVLAIVRVALIFVKRIGILTTFHPGGRGGQIRPEQFVGLLG